MHGRNYFTIIVCFIAALMLFSGMNAAAASIKEQMLARVPAINTLKDKGVLGENNQGFLEYRSDQKTNKEMVETENSDRRTVYAEIAKSQGVDVGLVGKRRAKQIADIGSPGHWFQKQDGSWYKK